MERCRLLEAAWARYLPQVPLETAIDAIRQQSSNTHEFESAPSDASPEQNQIPSPEQLEVARDPGDSSAKVDQEPEIEQLTSYEWDESADLASLADGIGSLSLHPKGVGYMGPQSGNALLRSLQPFYGSLLTTDDEYASYWNTDAQLGEQTLKSSAFSSRCVDAYFKYYHHAYPILHEGEFRAQWMGVLPKPRDGSWPILYNVILALGALSGDFSRQNADNYFYQTARQHLTWDILRRGSLPFVQALTLLANYLQKRDRPNSGFTLLGTAMNMAQGLGLHREFSANSINVQAMEIRRRVWWTLFIFDSGARLTFGRPTLALEGSNVSLPSNLDDGDLPADIEILPTPKDYTTVSSCLIWQIKIATIGNRINRELLRAAIPNVGTMMALSKQVHEWRNTLPKHMTERSEDPVEDIFEVPRMVLFWRSMHLRIIAHRPFILSTIKQRGSLVADEEASPHFECIIAASECVVSITSYWSFTSSRHGSLIWYACYWLVTAVFVHITCLLYAPNHASATEWRRHIELSRGALESMSQYELTALRAVRVIDQLLCKHPLHQRPPWMERR